jgi:prepilin-type N-terminal cleavage/methylation domain-containing protein
MRRGGFTLLEVVIALVILSTFAVACLQLRLSGLRAGQKIAQAQHIERALDDVLELAVDRMLPDPFVEKDDAGEVVRIVWKGDRFGEPFECVSEVVEVLAPTMAVPESTDADQPPPKSTVTMQRYTATLGNHTAVLLRPR